MIGVDEIERRLGFHPGTPYTAPKYEKNRNLVINLAEIWDTTLPSGRELSLALTALQEALMWANASIACAQPLGPERTDAATRTDVPQQRNPFSA